jgi:hypothetical protein
MKKWFSVFLTLFIGAGICSASSTVFTTPTGSTVGDGPVAATATFTTSNGVLTIQLTDFLSNPTSVGQLISGLQFDFGPSFPGTPLMTGSSAQEVSIAGGTATLGSVVSTGWGFGSYQSDYLVCVTCPNGMAQHPSAQPSHLIIGPGPYGNANSSINGNGPHNPFLNKTATFTIANAGITSSTGISGVTFYFGTSFGCGSPGVPGVPGSSVPEPVGTLLGATGCVALFLFRRKRAKANI